MTTENEETTIDTPTETPAVTEETSALVDTSAEETTETPTETEPPAEPAAPEEPKPAGWKAIEIAKREQLKLAAARQTLEAREAKVVQLEQQFEARSRQFQAIERQLTEKAARVELFEEAVRTGDIETLSKRFGLSYESLTRAAVEAHDPAARVAKLERELAERAKKDEEHRRAQSQVEQTRENARRLVELVDDHADDFPDLYAWPVDRIATDGISVRDAFFRRDGQMPTYDMVLAELQRRAKAESDARSDRLAKLEQKKSSASSDAGSAGKVDPKGNQVASPKTPSLSAATAVVRTTPPRQKTPEEVDEELRAMIRRDMFGR